MLRRRLSVLICCCTSALQRNTQKVGGMRESCAKHRLAGSFLFSVWMAVLLATALVPCCWSASSGTGFYRKWSREKTQISILRTLIKLIHTTECSFYRRGSITEKDLDLLVFSKPFAKMMKWIANNYSWHLKEKSPYICYFEESSRPHNYKVMLIR